MAYGDPLPEDEQPRGGCVIFLAPIVFLSLLIGGYLALFVLGSQGRAPTGDRVAMSFSVACDGAADGIEDRVKRMGLGAPTFTREPGQLLVEARLPADEEHAASIPDTLARTAAFTVLDPGGAVVVRNDQIDTAALRLDFSATPSVVLQLDDSGTRALMAAMKADPGGEMRMRFDDEVVDTRKNDPPEDGGKLQIAPEHERLHGVTRLAAAWSLWLEAGPLPCEARSTQTRVLSAGS